MPKRKLNLRNEPNIIITGTPGTGKSRLSEAVAAKTGLKWIDVSKESVDRGWVNGRDKKLDCAILDEDAMLDALELEVAPGGRILDYHACELFPERWIDQVFVLRTNNTTLFDRLTARGYNNVKIQNNISSEIFQTILEEAKDSYRKDIVNELKSDEESDVIVNVYCIAEWVNNFKKRNLSKIAGVRQRKSPRTCKI